LCGVGRDCIGDRDRVLWGWSGGDVDLAFPADPSPSVRLPLAVQHRAFDRDPARQESSLCTAHRSDDPITLHSRTLPRAFRAARQARESPQQRGVGRVVGSVDAEQRYELIGRAGSASAVREGTPWLLSAARRAVVVGQGRHLDPVRQPAPHGAGDGRIVAQLAGDWPSAPGQDRGGRHGAASQRGQAADQAESGAAERSHRHDKGPQHDARARLLGTRRCSRPQAVEVRVLTDLPPGRTLDAHQS